MRKLKVRAFGLSILVFIIACNSKIQSTKISEDFDAKDYITLSRGKCRGGCSVYDITLRGDGKMELEARENLDFIGSFTRQMDRDEAAELFKILSASFDSFQDSYIPKVSDYPSTLTTIKIGNKEKVINGTYKAPAELTHIIKKLDGILKNDDWTLSN